jgi:phosphatidylglycerol:prolipoprotein diacylglycerol transferase
LRPTLALIDLPGGAALTLPAYGTFLMLGLLLAVVVGAGRSRSVGLDRGSLFNMSYLTVLAALFGAHALDVLLNPTAYFGDRGESAASPSLATVLWRCMAFWQGGLAYYGGVAAGAGVLAAYAQRRRIPALEMMDFAAPLGVLGLAVTRIGCFLNGCCFGRPTRLPWAVEYPMGSPVHLAQVAGGLVRREDWPLPVHPSQLYETVAALFVFAVLWSLYPRRRFAGQIVLVFLSSYALWRFVSEFLRADSPAWRPAFGGLALDFAPFNVYQVLSLLILFSSTSALLSRWRRP